MCVRKSEVKSASCFYIDLVLIILFEFPKYGAAVESDFHTSQFISVINFEWMNWMNLVKLNLDLENI